MADYFPEHVVVRILARLPIKSLIRFTCVSKRWRFIILSDPRFAKSQILKSRRILLSGSGESEFDSLDSETPWPFGGSCTVSKRSCPFQQPDHVIRLLSSCNGLVCAALFNQDYWKPWNAYIWNPSTRFFKKLPDPVVPSTSYSLLFYGFGYLSATDDYKLLIAIRLLEDQEEENQTQAHVFSSKANGWKRIESPDPLYCNIQNKGILSNEALHWVRQGLDAEIVAFDVAAEEFRTMPLPDFHGLHFIELGAFGGCLCAFDDEKASPTGFIDLWIMKEYDVGDSWTKLFTLRVSDLPENIIYVRPVMVMETSTILEKVTSSRDWGTEFKLIRSGHEEEKLETHMVSRNSSNGNMIDYEESLLWFGDHNNRTCPIEPAEKARDTSEATEGNDGEKGRVDVIVDKQGPNTVNVCVQNQGNSSVDV